MPPTDAAARRLRMWAGRTLRERRRLSLPSAANRIQLFLQSLVFTFQPLAGALRLLKLSTQAISRTEHYDISHTAIREGKHDAHRGSSCQNHRR